MAKKETFKSADKYLMVIATTSHFNLIVARDAAILPA